jgi:hypothetical protein
MTKRKCCIEGDKVVIRKKRRRIKKQLDAVIAALVKTNATAQLKFH